MSLPTPAEIASALIAREEMPAEKGDIGPQGMDGKAGEFGPPGPQGAKGDPGRNGTNGSNGAVGLKGPIGPGGPRGPKGEKGDKGDEGERGPIGPMGPTGAVGSGKALFPRPGGGSSGGAPSGAAGGGLSGTYPNPGVVDDSHSHTSSTLPAAVTGFDYIQEADPGAVGAGKFWLFAGSLGYPDTYQLRRRNAGNTAWLPVTAIYTEQSEGVYINTPDNGSFLQLGLAGELTELSSGDGTALFLVGGGLHLHSETEPGLFQGEAAPSAGAGLVAPLGSVYLRHDAGVGEFWSKTGAGNTAWRKALILATVQTYTESNVTTDRAFNANATSIDELADVLGTLIADLRAQGVVA